MDSDVSGMYREAREAIAAAMEQVSAVEVDDKEGGEYLIAVREKLEQIAARFEEDIEFLDKNAEWEAFTVAFFGETNAGKSTIIEALRIIFNEAGRQKKIEEGAARVEALEAELSRDASALVSRLEDYGGGLVTELHGLMGALKSLAEASRDARQNAINVAAQVTVAQTRLARNRFWLGLVIGVGAGLVAGLGIGMLVP